MKNTLFFERIYSIFEIKIDIFKILKNEYKLNKKELNEIEHEYSYSKIITGVSQEI